MAYYNIQGRSWPQTRIPPSVVKITVTPSDNYQRTTQNHVGTPYYAPERHADVNYVRLQPVPRLFKWAISGWASSQSPGWPPDATLGPLQAYTPHHRIRTVQRNTGRAVGAVAVLRPASAGRIAPIPVPRARFAR